MDTYQAVYDAVRSRITGCDVSNAVANALDFSAVNARMHEAISTIEFEQLRPSVVYKPDLRIDGNKWSALYGPNIQEGVCGFGDTPDEAMRAFDAAWYARIAA